MNSSSISGSKLKIHSWRNTLDKLREQTGIGFKEVCEYIGSVYNPEGVSYYVKLPRDRRVYIGIGMAYRQPLEVINEWITYYADKRRLYAKDISEDLVWIYLINANYAAANAASCGNLESDRSLDPQYLSSKSRQNLFLSYDDYQAKAYSVFRERWDELILTCEDTRNVEISLGQADYSKEFDGLKMFVLEHMDAFKTAYTKPRVYLDKYLEQVIKTCATNPRTESFSSLNSMRGILDDSMINFLSGDSEAINAIDRSTGKRTINIKHVPKGKKFYIKLCLALGMTLEEIDHILELMGFAHLNDEDKTERELIRALTVWENRHPEQRAYKNKYFKGIMDEQLTLEDEQIAVEDMLQLRSDLADYYAFSEKPFPYANR